MTAPAVIKSEKLRHEEFCLPRPGSDKPRIEGYVHYEDGPQGRSVPTHDVIRCMECGAATYNRRF